MMNNLKNKILFFTPIFPPQYSGATFQAITLAHELRKQNVEVSFLAFRDVPANISFAKFTKEQFNGFSVCIVPVKGLARIVEGKCGLLTYSLLIIRLFIAIYSIRHDYLIIHCHLLGFPFTVLSVIGKLLNKKVVAKATMLDDICFEQFGNISGKINRYFVLLFDKIISISSEIAVAMASAGIPSDKIENISNAVDIFRFHPIDNDGKINLKRKLNITENFIFIFIGGVTYRKGVDKLIQIWVEFAKIYHDTKLFIVGPRSTHEGAMGDQYCTDVILSYLQQNGLSDKVQLTGNIENVVSYLQMSDVFLFPSTLEGMPNVVLEAMACGLPVVTYNVSGISDIITNGFDGEIINLNDNDSFLHSIISLYEDRHKCKLYSERARLTICDQFNVANIANKYKVLYKKLLLKDNNQ